MSYSYEQQGPDVTVDSAVVAKVKLQVNFCETVTLLRMFPLFSHSCHRPLLPAPCPSSPAAGRVLDDRNQGSAVRA